MPRPVHTATDKFLRTAAAATETRDDLANATVRFSRALARAHQRANRAAALLRDAELLERDPVARALFPEAQQKLGAMNRLATEIGEKVRQLVAVERELQAHAERIRDNLADDLPAALPGAGGAT